MILGAHTVRLDFHSTFEMLDVVQAVSEHLGRLAGLDDDALHWVTVAVRESVINAIKHGNGGDQQKQVHVDFTPLDCARMVLIASSRSRTRCWRSKSRIFS